MDNNTLYERIHFMKLCSAEYNGSQFVGVLTDNGIADVTALGFPAQMNEIIEGGEKMLARIDEVVREKKPPTISEQAIKFLPVTAPKKIICEGLNFKDHAEETGGEIPGHPVFFSKFNDALAAHNEPIRLPVWFNRFDYEAELVIVIGKSAYNVSTEDAETCIFGYTCGNDLSARDAQFLSSQWLCGKSLPSFGPVGPFIVTRDSFDAQKPHGIFCEVNGTVVQSGNTSDMIFPCFETVSAASRFFPLSPGDLIFTGTPAGVIQGKKKEDRVWLKAGDVVKVSIDGLGALVSPLIQP